MEKNPHYNEEWVSKSKKTKLERYGDENYCNVKKIKNTKLENFGDENFNNREKAYETMMREYGVKQYSNTEKMVQTRLNYTEEKKREVEEKKENTRLERYGVKHLFQLPEMREYIERVCEERTGYKYPFTSPESRMKILRNRRRKMLERMKAENEYQLLSDENEFISNSDRSILWKLRHKCGHEFETTFKGILHDQCPKCYPKILHKSQHKIFEFLNGLDCFDDLKENCKGVLTFGEIDIYSRHSKFAVEYDGMIFHAFEKNAIRGVKGKPINYHLKKTEECEEMGIRLLHITDSEWNENENLCRSLMRERLGMLKRRIDAGRCTIREIDTYTKNRFLEKYSFGGSDFSGIRLGMYFGKRLVGVMTLKRKGRDLEVSRVGKLNWF